MNPNTHQFHQCTREACGFRYPTHKFTHSHTLCPRCGAPTFIIDSVEESPKVPPPPLQENSFHLEVLLDNIRSAFNVGSIFRSADGAGFKHVHLSGMSATPEHSKVKKTALGAEKSLSWTYYNNAIEAVESFKKRKLRIWGLEGGPNAVSLFDSLEEVAGLPIALVVGNEVSGIDPSLLASCEKTVYIPMAGYKQSLNVAVAFGIAAYFLQHGYNTFVKSTPILQ